MNPLDLPIEWRARLTGYTQPLTIHTPCETLTVWARPKTDWDGVFAVIDSETGERLTMTGWAVDIEPGHV